MSQIKKKRSHYEPRFFNLFDKLSPPLTESDTRQSRQTLIPPQGGKPYTSSSAIIGFLKTILPSKTSITIREALSIVPLNSAFESSFNTCF